MGLGTDTLKLVGGNWDFNSANYVLTGVDILDVSDATGTVQLKIGSALALSTDLSKFTIISGAAGISSLDLSTVPSVKAVYLKGQGTVVLAENSVNTLTIEAPSDFIIQGSNGADTLKIRGGNVLADLGIGNDSFSVSGSGSYELKGGDGNDSFFFNSGEFMEGATIVGGAGTDEVRVYNTFALDAADIAKISGIEKVTIYGNNTVLSAIGTVFESRIEFKGVGTNLQLDVDISNMTSAQVAVFAENLFVNVTSNVGQAYKLETTSKFNGELHGGLGHEQMTGASGIDRLYGEDGNDTLFGLGGNDILNGGSGSDRLNGGAGLDQLTGGSGNDVFSISTRTDGADTITDFNALVGEQDILDLTALFASNGLGTLGAAAAVAAGYLTLTEQAGNVVVGFDRDGSAKATYSTATIATLLDTSLSDLLPTSIITV